MSSQIDNENNWKILVLMLKNIAIEKGITQQEIANRTGYLQSGVARIFSLKFPPTLETFICIAQAIGVNFFFEDKEGQSDLNKCFEQAMEQI